MRKSRIAAILLAGLLAVSGVIGCGQKETVGTTGALEQTEETMRIGSLKGPTTMGLVNLMQAAEEGKTVNTYTFTMETQADVLLASMVNGDLDAALIPANVASVLYQKTKGQISVVNINTLGVLYIVTGDETVKSIADLKGRTLYLTGKGATPDYAIRYLIQASAMELSDVHLEYKSEAAEVAAVLKQDSGAIGLLPQPFATVVCVQNQEVKVALDLNQIWADLQTDGGSQLVTGVTVVRKAYLEEHPEAVKAFMEEAEASAKLAVSDVAGTAELVAKTGIIEKAAIAQKALPYCNITYIDGSRMQAALSGYLKVLYDQEPKSVGGALPAEDFYYLPEK